MSDTNGGHIKSKKDLVKLVQNGSSIKPVVIYELIRNDILNKEEFINIFQLNYQGEHREHLVGVYNQFWDMMERNITLKDNKDEGESNE